MAIHMLPRAGGAVQQGSGSDGIEVAEEAGDALQAAVGGELGDVDAGDGDGAVVTGEVPAEAGEAVVLVDGGEPGDALAGVVLVHGLDYLAELGAAVGGQQGIAVRGVGDPRLLDERGAGGSVVLVPHGDVGVDDSLGGGG